MPVIASGQSNQAIAEKKNRRVYASANLKLMHSLAQIYRFNGFNR